MKPVLQTRRAGWTRTDLLAVIVVVFVGLVLVGLLLSALSGARSKPQRTNCANCLRQIGEAFQLWAGNHGDKYPMQISGTNGGTMELITSGRVFPLFQALSNELNTPYLLVCNGDSERTRATNFTSDLNDGKVSYFVGVDAAANRPQMLLAGDRQLTLEKVPVRPALLTLRTNAPVGWAKGIHSSPPGDRKARRGNVVLVDGSVQLLDGPQLQRQLQVSSVTNRLAIP